jgi:hypothetical protein
MICSHCFELVADTANYCAHCGRVVGAPARIGVAGWASAVLAFLGAGSLGFLILMKLF